MNPRATLRFRNATASLATVWAVVAIVLALVPVVFPRDVPTLPFNTTAIAGVVIVQAPGEAARAAGVEPGDRVVGVDGQPVLYGLREGNVLELGRRNTYTMESGTRGNYAVELEPEALSFRTASGWQIALYTGLL